MDIIKLIPPEKSTDECYKAGFDCAMNGANTKNCHFSLFSSPENTRRWEDGKRDGDAARGVLDQEYEQSTLHG